MVFDVREHIHWDQDKKYSFENDYNLILPDISVGNVGQLTVDLLLNNLTTEHVGRVVHPCLMPFVGSDPFDPGSNRLTSGCEIYVCEEKQLVILQIRSLVCPGKFQLFKDLIFGFMMQFRFKATIVVSSSFSEYFAAEQLQNVPLHYLSSTAFSDHDALAQLKWNVFQSPQNVDFTGIPRLPGSFLALPLIRMCSVQTVPVVVLICLCSEGNNYPEALHVVKCINSWLSLKQPKGSEEIWRFPVSWRLPYGNAAPSIMY